MTESITISPQRRIGDLDIDCTIREQSTDVYTPTKKPVQQGAAITDHVYREPAQLVFEVGFSNSSAKAGGSNSYVVDIYDKLRKLQGERQPLVAVTGKRTYKNMIIASLAVTTDNETEAVLMCTATLTEIIIVSVQVTSVPSAEKQAKPQETAAVEQRGSLQPRPATLSPGGLFDAAKTAVKEIPLIASPQAFSMQLNNVTYNLTAAWRDVANTAVGDAVAALGGGWMLDIADQVGSRIISGIPLVTGSDLLEQYKYLGIDAKLIVQTSNDIDAVPTFDNLGLTSHLYAALTGG